MLLAWKSILPENLRLSACGDGNFADKIDYLYNRNGYLAGKISYLVENVGYFDNRIDNMTGRIY